MPRLRRVISCHALPHQYVEDYMHVCGDNNVTKSITDPYICQLVTPLGQAVVAAAQLVQLLQRNRSTTNDFHLFSLLSGVGEESQNNQTQEKGCLIISLFVVSRRVVTPRLRVLLLLLLSAVWLLVPNSKSRLCFIIDDTDVLQVVPSPRIRMRITRSDVYSHSTPESSHCSPSCSLAEEGAGVRVASS